MKCIQLIAADQRAVWESEGADSKAGNLKADSLLPLFRRSRCTGKQMVQMHSLRLKHWIQELVLLVQKPSHIVSNNVYNLFGGGEEWINPLLVPVVLCNKK